MKRHHPIRLSVEELEGKSLLSVVNPMTDDAVAALVVRDVSPLILSVRTDQVAYQPGRAVSMTLTERNAGDRDISVAEGCGIADFWVTRHGVEVWRQSRDEFQALCPVSLGVLRPNQSRTFGAVWANPEGLRGRFDVHAQVDGLRAEPALIRTPSPLAFRVTTDRRIYRLGEQVRITLTEKNRSNRAVPLNPLCWQWDLSVTNRKGAVIWQRHQASHCMYADIETLFLRPGERRRVTFVWDGHPSSLDAPVTPDIHTIRARLDGVAGASRIRIRK